MRIERCCECKKISVRDVYMLGGANKILVHVNEESQLTNASGGLCNWFMMTIVRQPNICSPDAKDFKKVKDRYGVRLIEEVRDKFVLSQTAEGDKVLFATYNSKYRNNKYELKKNIFKEAKKKLEEARRDVEIDDTQQEEEDEHQFSKKEILEALDMTDIPSGFSDRQLVKFKNYLRSPKAKEISEKGKAARATQIHTHTHTTGSKSYSRKKQEFVHNKRNPYEVEFFDIAHTTKDGSYVQEDSKEFLDVARKEIDKKITELG